MSDNSDVPSASVRLDPRHSVRAFVAFQALALVLFGGWVSVLLGYPAYLLLAYAADRFFPALARGARVPVPAGGRHAVLVTGTSSGIGRSAALALLREGMTVLATVRKSADGKTLQGEARAAGVADRLAVLLLDVTDEASVAAARAKAEAELEKRGAHLVGLVNNAGYSNSAPVELLPLDSLRHQYETNVVGLVGVTQAFLPLLRRAGAESGRRARVVNVSSVVGTFSGAGMGPYASSKYAVEALSDALRQELAPWPVDVVIVQPGAIRTSFQKTFADTFEDNMGRVREGVDAGVLATYRASVKAHYKSRESRPYGTTAHTDAAIVDALLDGAPLPRYLAGRDARFLVPVLLLLPDRLKDRIIGKAWRIEPVDA